MLSSEATSRTVRKKTVTHANITSGGAETQYRDVGSRSVSFPFNMDGPLPPPPPPPPTNSNRYSELISPHIQNAVIISM